MQYNTEISSGITEKHRERFCFLAGHTVSTLYWVFFCMYSSMLLVLCVISAGARFLALDGKTLEMQSL